jgi:HK97 family phage portal protein
MFSAVAREFRDFINSFSGPDSSLGMFGGTPASSGVAVTEISALQSPVVFACHRILSALFAKTPMHIYEKLSGGGRTIADKHPWERALTVKPNDEMSSFEFKEVSMVHMVSRGNSYAKIERDNLGRVAGWYPLSPFNCAPYRDGKTGDIIYQFTNVNGTTMNIAAKDVLHVKNISLEGLVGLTPIQQYAKEAIGLDIALRAYGSRFIANGGSASMLMQFKGKISPADRKLYERDIQQAHSGVNAHRALVLDQGGDLKNLSISPEEAQFLETRGFQRDEIAECIYGVPSHLVGGHEETKAGIGEQQSALLSNTMSAWFARYKSAYNAKLFPDNPSNKWENGDKYEVGFDTTEMDSYRILEALKTVTAARQWGIGSGNEGRKLIGWNAFDKQDSKDPADKLWRPVNMVPMSEDSENMPPTPAPSAEPNVKAADTTDATDNAARNVFTRVFRDAFNRVIARDTRNEKVVSGAFTAPISAISDYFLMINDANFRSGNAFPEEIDAFISGYIESMTKRCTTWNATESGAQCDAELTRAITEIKKRVGAIERAENE